jgi:hypothetical protein
MNFARTPIKNAPINNRDALYGGRTEDSKTYYRVKEGKVIQYVDVISLYPYICKYGKFSVGHPEVYVGADCPPDCVDREGIIKCKVLPPKELSSSFTIQKQFQTDVSLVFSLCLHYEPGQLYIL